MQHDLLELLVGRTGDKELLKKNIYLVFECSFVNGIRVKLAAMLMFQSINMTRAATGLILRGGRRYI